MMNTNYAKSGKTHLPDAGLHRSDPNYLRELLAAANLSQRAAARLIGIDERSMRNYASGKREIPYVLQYCLEVLAAGTGPRVADVPRFTVWFNQADRRLTPADVGKIIVGRVSDGYVAGIVKADGWGVTIAPLPGHDAVDGGDTPAGAVTQYVLIDVPA